MDTLKLLSQRTRSRLRFEETEDKHSNQNFLSALDLPQSLRNHSLEIMKYFIFTHNNTLTHDISLLMNAI